jgi:hypothetical protein
MHSVTGESLARVADRGREHVAHRQAAEPGVQLEPSVGGAGHADRQEAALRNRRAAELPELALQLLEAQAERRTARRVEPVELLRLAVPDDREQVAAEAAARGFHEPERRVRGDRGVDRAATGLQHVHGDLRRERMRGRSHAVSRDDLRARRERPARDAVDLREHGAMREREREERREACSRHYRTLARARGPVKWLNRASERRRRCANSPPTRFDSGTDVLEAHAGASLQKLRPQLQETIDGFLGLLFIHSLVVVRHWVILGQQRLVAY